MDLKYQVETNDTKMLSGCPIPATTTANIAISVVIAILLIAGVTGNVITLIVILKNKHLQTNFNRFLMSLCASDLVSACICSPLWLYRRGWGYVDWQWGQFLCKFYWVVDYGTNFITSLHVLSFCILRFMAFSKPFSAPTSRLSSGQLAIYLVSLWLGSILVALPHAYFMGARDRDATDPWPSCSVILDRTEPYRTYSVTVCSLFFYIPGFFIIMFSFFTSRILSKMKRPSDSSGRAEKIRAHFLHRRNKSACFQLRLICTCFIIGYVPLSAYPIWTTAVPEKKCTSSLFIADYWMGVMAYIILRISECLNPVMYNLGCRDMRRATIRFLRGRKPERRDISARSTTHSDAMFSTLHPLSMKSSSTGT